MNGPAAAYAAATASFMRLILVQESARMMKKYF